MTDHFTGSTDISLQPNDLDIPYSFRFRTCTSAGANNGIIPYGETVSSITTTAWNSSGVNVTSNMIKSATVFTVSTGILVVPLSYPGTEGDYSLRFVVALESGSTIEADFETVVAEQVGYG